MVQEAAKKGKTSWFPVPPLLVVVIKVLEICVSHPPLSVCELLQV